MIRLRKPKVPVALNGSDSIGGTETREAIKHFRTKKNWTVKFPFDAYRHREVRETLTEMFHGKCAYCESTYRQGFPVDVEHFRPKKGVTLNQGGKDVLTPPGYYWLAANWDNLLPSCGDCNRARKQRVGGLPPQLYGKGNQFPLINEDKRATKKGEERSERRLLLHPYRDRPDEHLEFDESGNVLVVGSSRMGAESIRVYALRRRGLMQERAARAKEITAAVEAYRAARDLLAADPGSDVLQRLVEANERAVCAFLDPQRPYLAMARQLVEGAIPDWKTRCRE